MANSLIWVWVRRFWCYTVPVTLRGRSAIISEKAVLCFPETSGFVLSGDVLFAGSLGRSDFPQGDPEKLMESIRNKLLVLPDDTKVLSGHGEETTIGIERRSNPYINGYFD